MATTRVKKGASKVHHLGRHKAKILQYYERTYPLRKLRRILKHNKQADARAWAKEHGALPLFDRLVA
jgi:hypothetical protein